MSFTERLCLSAAPRLFTARIAAERATPEQPPVSGRSPFGALARLAR